MCSRASGRVIPCTTPTPVSFFNAQSIWAQYFCSQSGDRPVIPTHQTRYGQRTSRNSCPTASTISTLTTRSNTPSHSPGMLL